MKLVGFIGGCGGHLHNLGVMLMKVSELPPGKIGSSDVPSVLNEKLLRLANEHKLYECGYLYSHPVSSILFMACSLSFCFQSETTQSSQVGRLISKHHLGFVAVILTML